MSEPRYMLDTNVVSDMIRNPRGAVAGMVRKIGVQKVCASAIVASELRYGARKKGSPRLESLVDELLARIVVLDYDEAASKSYAQMRTALERDGQPIGSTDLFIAAHAVSRDMTLVTANLREFLRVAGLKLENWLEAD